MRDGEDDMPPMAPPRWVRGIFVLFGVANIVGALLTFSDRTLPGVVVGFDSHGNSHPFRRPHAIEACQIAFIQKN